MTILSMITRSIVVGAILASCGDPTFGTDRIVSAEINAIQKAQARSRTNEIKKVFKFASELTTKREDAYRQAGLDTPQKVDAAFAPWFQSDGPVLGAALTTYQALTNLSKDPNVTLITFATEWVKIVPGATEPILLIAKQMVKPAPESVTMPQPDQRALVNLSTKDLEAIVNMDIATDWFTESMNDDLYRNQMSRMTFGSL